ncbi:MAG: hypothetical protein MPN21_10485 [Thermoanaerobaculia bacterium]|nr:hypothetical protein [Thermoanaerobaculia bacterium]
MSLTSLWLPIVVAAVCVQITSTLSWMVLRLHRNDWAKLDDEDSVMSAIRAAGAGKGEYTFPFSAGPEDWKDEAWQAKFKEGPVGFLTLAQPGEMAIGKSMAVYFVYLLILQSLVAYVASVTLSAGAECLAVFQIVGTVAILAFAGGSPPNAIWLHRKWSNIWREIFDGVVYGLVTGAVFCWLWPAG